LCSALESSDYNDELDFNKRQNLPQNPDDETNKQKMTKWNI